MWRYLFFAKFSLSCVHVYYNGLLRVFTTSLRLSRVFISTSNCIYLDLELSDVSSLRVFTTDPRPSNKEISSTEVESVSPVVFKLACFPHLHQLD